jgi:6-phosphogluconolactonase
MEGVMSLARRILVLVVALVAALGWTACGGGCPTTSLSSSGGAGGGSPGGVNTGGTTCGSGNNGTGGKSAAFLYYLGTNDILGASLSTSGTFTNLTSVTPPTLPSSVGADMIVVNKTFLYLPQSDSLKIQAFTIDHTSGALTAISGSPFPTAGADSIASDPAGRFLFVGNNTTGQIAVFQINATKGVLTPAPNSPVTAFNLDFVHVLAVDGSGRFLYAGQGSPFLPIYGFSIDQNTGALSPIAGSPFALNVAGVRTDFSGKHAVGLSGTVGDNHLYVFAIDPTTGGLSSVSGSPFPTTATRLFDLKIHPRGQFVYSFGQDANSNIAALEGFTLDPTSGALTALPGSPFTTLPKVADCKWDQGGAEAFCANAATSAFSVFDTNASTGALAHTVTDLSVVSNAVAFAPTD